MKKGVTNYNNNNNNNNNNEYFLIIFGDDASDFYNLAINKDIFYFLRS